jgi:hypothetical protein
MSSRGRMRRRLDSLAGYGSTLGGASMEDASHKRTVPLRRRPMASLHGQLAVAGVPRGVTALGQALVYDCNGINPRRPKANNGPPGPGSTRSALSCATSRSTEDRTWCALPRSRSRSSDTGSSQTALKTAPPGALFAILSAHMDWPRPPKLTRNSSNNLQRRREVDAAAGRADLIDPIALIMLVVAATCRSRSAGCSPTAATRRRRQTSIERGAGRRRLVAGSLPAERGRDSAIHSRRPTDLSVARLRAYARTKGEGTGQSASASGGHAHATRRWHAQRDRGQRSHRGF